MPATIARDNDALLNLLSRYLCDTPCAITPADVHALCDDCGVDEPYAYGALLASFCGLDTAEGLGARLFHQYFPKMLRRLSPSLCLQDAYTLTVPLQEAVEGGIRLCMKAYQPMELFVCDDFRFDGDGRLLPQLGWFDTPVSYPAIEENGRIWMTVTPNEINTIQPAVKASFGKVLAYGLGLGYYAFHACERAEVSSVTVVEKSTEVIRLFRRCILPHFPHGEKLTIVEADAFDYAARTAPSAGFDTVFTDLWHDAGDGVPLYRRMKALEVTGVRYLYWIEPTLRAYMEDAPC